MALVWLETVSVTLNASNRVLIQSIELRIEIVGALGRVVFS